MYKCPKGHDSTDADYCSECGSPIGATPVADQASNFASAPATGGNDVCPDCQTPREPGMQYCEVCRYDFVNHASFQPNAAAPKVLAVSATQVSQQPVSSASALVADLTPLPVASDLLLVAVNVDPALDNDHDPDNPAPAGVDEFVFHLDLSENVVGRVSESKGIHPEIPVKDKGVSRRHLKFVRNGDGSYSALELGSANGTVLNGQKLVPGANTPIKHGDEFVIGSWTRLSIRNR
jgi:hypothetical protein